MHMFAIGMLGRRSPGMNQQIIAATETVTSSILRLVQTQNSYWVNSPYTMVEV
jgi:hypothetical protein